MHPLNLANVALWWVRFSQMGQNHGLVEVVAPAWTVVMFYVIEIKRSPCRL